MYPKLEIYEPGLDVAIITLEARANSDGIVVVGRSSNAHESHHISVRKAPRLVSRNHCSLRLNEDFGIDILDGTFIGESYVPSRNGTWLDGDRVERGRWLPTRLDSRISLGDPRKPELQGFFLRLESGETDSGMGSVSTVSFSAHEMWNSARLTTKSGCMLLRPMRDGSVAVLALDLQTEVELGAQPSELVSSAGRFSLEALVANDEYGILRSQIATSMRADTPVVGAYTYQGQIEYRLTTARRLVQGEFFLLGFVEAIRPKKPQSPTAEGWPSIVGLVVDSFRDAHPIWLVALLLGALALYLALGG